jgi:hypothetical protein
MQNYTDLPLVKADAILSVATSADLPTSNVVEGSIRYVEDVDQLWTFDGSAWAAAGGGLSSSSVADTNSTDLTVTLGVLTSDLKLSNVAATSGNLKATTSIKGGTGAAQGLHVEIPEASGSQTGVLTSANWTTFNGKLDPNVAIVAGTKTKITYDTDGLVTAGADLASGDIPNLDANKITSGTFDIARIPAAALERVVVVADQPARYALTTATVQNGDTVYQTDTAVMYFVIDDTQLSSAAGYRVYSAGTAAAVPWTGVTSKPDNITAIAALTGPGIVVKTSTDPAAVTFAQRTITGTANRLGVTYGDGAGGNPTLNVDATQFPNSTAANDGLPLVASSSANTATWRVPQSTVDLQQSGFVSWGGSGNYYSLSSGTFTVLRAGVGRLSGSKITWAGGESVGSLAADKTYYIGYNATNTLVAIDAATIYSASPETYYENMHTMFINNVILFTVWMDTVTPVVSHENHPYEYGTDISVHDHFRLGHVFTGTGAMLSVLSSANATVQSIGEDRLDDHGLSSKVPDLTGAVLDVTPVFKNASGRAKRYNRRVFTVSGVSVTPVYPKAYTNNGSTFTVLHTNIVAGSGTIICWTSSGTSLPQASGTLTGVPGGTGDATITFSAYTSPAGCSSTYTPANVVTPLGTGGATRYGIWAVYLVKSDLQTPTTADPVPTYIWVPSTVAYNSSANAALSLGAGTAPDMTQFQQSSDLLALEPCLNGFVLMDGSTRVIPAYTGNGFTAGVRTFKATSAGQFSAGAVAVAAAVNVAADTTNFNSLLSSADVNVQLALETLDNYMSTIAVSTNVTLTANKVHLVDTTSGLSLALPTPTNGVRVIVKDAIGTGADTNQIGLTSAGTIEGAASPYYLSELRGSLTLVADGTNWWII